MKKIPVGILGATGAVGQRFIQLLDNHPWFEITHLYASERSAGQSYQEATPWRMDTVLPDTIADMQVDVCEPNNKTPRLVFSALDSTVATEVEAKFAKHGAAVISNSKNYRMDPLVPLVVPEVNPDQLDLIATQKKQYKSQGFIVTNPNCTTIGLTMVLAPLYEAFGIEKVSVVSLQASSGAGYPGVPSLDLIDNVVPYISDEEDKIVCEPCKILGSTKNGAVTPAEIAIDATSTRVGLRDGHIEIVSMTFTKQPSSHEEIRSVLEGFSGLPQQLALPSAPEHPIEYCTDPARPQPALDRMRGKGMTVTVGRLRESKLFDITLTLLVHNTIRGAAGAAILNAELLYKQGRLS